MHTTRLTRWAAYAGLVVAVIGMHACATATTASAATSERATGVAIYTDVSALRLSEPEKIASARCPDGKRVLGGGGRVVRVGGGTTNGKVILNSAVPQSRPRTGGGFIDNYLVRAHEWVGGYSDNWYVVAYAVCGDPIDGLQIVSRGSDDLTSTQPLVRKSHASCPSGTKVIGTGGSIFGGVNRDDRVSLRQIRPNQQGAYVFVEGIAHPGYTPDFDVWAYAVCAEAPLGWHVVIDGNDFSSDQTQATSVACPAGEQALGAGFTKGDNQGASHIEYFFPYTTSTTSKVYVGGGAPFPPQPWNIAAWAVCVTR